MTSIVVAKNVVKKYGRVAALAGVNLVLEEGKQYVIQGASGSGKSTFLHLMAGLDRPSSGELIVCGQNLSQMNDKQLAAYRNKTVGLVFQFHFLLSSMNCLENIMLPSKIGGENYAAVKERVLIFAHALGVEQCLNKYPFELSGGEQQRINIIRAISLSPRLILCDEPTGNLDSNNSQLVVSLLKELARKDKSTLVIVTHDRSVASCFENRLQMKDGIAASTIVRSKDY